MVRTVIRFPVWIRGNDVDPIVTLLFTETNVVFKSGSRTDRSFDCVVIPLKPVGTTREPCITNSKIRRAIRIAEGVTIRRRFNKSTPQWIFFFFFFSPFDGRERSILACDYFFEQKRTQHGKIEDEQAENLKLKEDVCTDLESHAAARTATHEILKELQDKFNSIGFVPRKDISAIRSRYHEAVERFINSIPGITENEKGKISLENQLSDLRNDPMADRKIYQKEQVIRKKISKIENDIGLWQNNLEFFSRSQNAEKVREEFNDKIRTANEHLKQLKDQLKLLKTV